ncbi:hypothetical protein DFH09DRAFT_1075915 [Mycena vulgaris]|nr:hypothetical protein DFH09DRAFT_1075915 [Mycena vulgaris]
MSNITMPGISVPVVLMAGIIGNEEPLFSLVDWSITTEVDATTNSIVIHLVDCTPSGSLFQIEAGIMKSCQPAVHLRIALENVTAFWALAYLSVKSSASRPTALSLSIEDHRHITSMLEYFKGDEGPEFCMGGGTESAKEDHPPGYTGSGHTSAVTPRDFALLGRIPQIDLFSGSNGKSGPTMLSGLVRHTRLWLNLVQKWGTGGLVAELMVCIVEPELLLLMCKPIISALEQSRGVTALVWSLPQLR